jgi:hypothetical protein
MKQKKEQFIWLLVCALFFVSYGVFTNYYKLNNAEKTLIIIDTSFDMKSKKADLNSLIKELTLSKFQHYQLLSEKIVLKKGWNQKLAIPNITFYGTRNFDFKDKYQKQIEEADLKILITNADNVALINFDDWQIINP